MRISEICSRNLDSQIKILRDGSQLHTVLFRHHMLAFRNVTLITYVLANLQKAKFLLLSYSVRYEKWHDLGIAYMHARRGGGTFL